MFKALCFTWLALVTWTLTASSEMLSTKAALIERVETRQARMKQRYAITWPDTSRLIIQVGFPDSSKTYSDLLRPASYTFDPPTIWVNPLALALPDSIGGPRRILQDMVRKLYGNFDTNLDHELTHHYYALEFRRLTGLRAPRILKKGYIANFIAHKIMSEGLATAVERDSLPPFTPDSWWPMELDLAKDDALKNPEDWDLLCYEGGWRMIAPLVDEFGLAATTEYIIRYPLTLPDKYVRARITQWRQFAYVRLSAQALKH